MGLIETKPNNSFHKIGIIIESSNIENKVRAARRLLKIRIVLNYK